jgi:hypothetical protein
MGEEEEEEEEEEDNTVYTVQCKKTAPGNVRTTAHCLFTYLKPTSIIGGQAEQYLRNFLVFNSE